MLDGRKLVGTPGVFDLGISAAKVADTLEEIAKDIRSGFIVVKEVERSVVDLSEDWQRRKFVLVMHRKYVEK